MKAYYVLIIPVNLLCHFSIDTVSFFRGVAYWGLQCVCLTVAVCSCGVGFSEMVA